MDNLPIELIENIFYHVCKDNNAFFCYKKELINIYEKMVTSRFLDDKQ